MTKYVYTYLHLEIGEMGEMDEIVKMVEIGHHFAHFARATSLIFCSYEANQKGHLKNFDILCLM